MFVRSQTADDGTTTGPVAMASLRVAVLHTCGYQKRDAFHPSVPHDRAA